MNPCIYRRYQVFYVSKLKTLLKVVPEGEFDVPEGEPEGEEAVDKHKINQSEFES